MSIFSQVPRTRISRSRHNLSHQVKMSFDPGKIYPIMTELLTPGQSMRVSLEQFVRTMPMIAPVMDRVDIKIDAFAVPLRLIWDDFEDFITLGPTGKFTALKPNICLYGRTLDSGDLSTRKALFGTSSLSDYLNFPSRYIDSLHTGDTIGDIKRDALPYRAYQLIYSEYFRNQDLEPEVPIARSSGDQYLTAPGPLNPPENFYTEFFIRNRGWRKDYFTSALPSPQKGPAVRIPTSDLKITDDGALVFENGTSTNPGLKPQGVPLGSEVTMVTDVSAVSPTELSYKKGLAIEGAVPTIEELRYAETLQEFYEANARGGSRYKEYLLNIWHTKSKDSRLDRPEYLGGYRGPITITDIDQTSESATSPQGTLAGKGVSAGGNKLFRYRTSEWCIIMVTMSVIPKSAYFQGFRKWNLYDDVFDWPCPYFANLGEQEIKNLELYDDPTDDQNNSTFGYTPRYAEAKYIPDSVHGQFRTTLDYWHLGRKFSQRPNLNSNFVHCFPEEVSRAFPLQVSNDDKLVGTFFFHISSKMYLPYWGVPRLIHSI